MAKQRPTGKELRKNYGVLGLSIIEIVGIILVLALIVTIIYQVV